MVAGQKGLTDPGPPYKYDKGVPSWWNQETVSRRVAQKMSDFIVTSFGFGAYPLEYDRAKHGPYDPRVKYTTTTPETPVMELAVGDLPKYLASRKYTPRAMLQLMGRAKARWWGHYGGAKYPHPAMNWMQLVFLVYTPYFAWLHYQHTKHTYKFKHH